MSEPARLYGIRQSHAVLAARLMLAHAGIRHDVRDVLPGLHPFAVRAAGFRGWTVPALRLGGRRIQGTLAISRALDEIEGAPPLFPADPARRREVEAAERWGHDELQEPVRRIFRWAGSESNVVRTWLSHEVMHLPAPALAGQLSRPAYLAFSRVSKATTARIRADLAQLPAKLDHADGLVARETIGGAEPNAADFQICASLRLLLAFDDLRPLLAARRCGQAALALVPHFPVPPPGELPPIPPVLPAAWIPAPVAA